MTSRKQILLVEPDAALRSEAEKVLRQAGYEVVSVDSAARAEGILTVSRFDLAVVGIQVQGENNVPFYQNWAENPERAGAPFLLLCAENESASDLPDEAIVRYPFAPEDLLTKVEIFTGSGVAPVATNTAEASSLFADDEVDGALDKAFGLDQIDVHESEVLGAKDSSEISTVAKSESLVGYDAEITSVTTTQKATTDTSKIDLAFMQNKLRDMAASKKEVSDSSDLDLASASTEFENQQEAQKATQQATPQAPQGSPSKDTDSHDYEWFAAEMQGDGATPSKAQPKKVSAPASPSTDGGVVEKSVADEGVFEWSDAPASIDSVANVFSEQMADAVARRVAERLVQQLNSDKFAQLIQQEIKAYLKERS